MKYDWYLFDLDGTLTESGEGIINCAKHAVRALGAEVPPDDEMQAFIGPPLFWSFTNVCHMDEKTAMRAVELYRERYSEIGWRENRVYTGIAPLLRGIKRRGGHIGVATGKPDKYCRLILDYFGLRPYVDSVSAITMTDHHADKRALILRALPEDADLSRVVMVGDRIFDIEGARDAGVKSVGAAYGYGPRSEFEGAVAIADSPADLWAILIGGPRDAGDFITFEGGDGCGKSTQFSMAREYLEKRGWDVAVSREPGGCPISERIRELLLDVNSKGMTPRCEALLYAAARAQHVSQVIKPALAAGKTLLCDRFLDSSIAYQGFGRELTEKLVRQINEPAAEGLLPGLTLYYAADAETARRRREAGGAPDRIESEGGDFVTRVSAGFDALALGAPERIKRIDAGQDIDHVFRETARLIDEYLS